MGVSYDTSYRYEELIEDDGIDSLISRSRRTPNLKNPIGEYTELALLVHAVNYSVHGK